MANPEHLAKLKEGVEAWNAWRETNPDVRPDLDGADLREADLRRANIREANLRETSLYRADLSEAYLSGAYLSGADLNKANLFRANLSGAILSKANLIGASLYGANLSEADLSWADLNGASLYGAILNEADLSGANLYRANLYRANLYRANLIETNLIETNLYSANLNWADLSGADLRAASLIKTKLHGTDLTGAHIYGISAWNVERDEHTKQNDLIITNWDEPTVTVDNLDVAQFVYLLLKNQRIRQIFDTITSRAVLILGRFSDERKAVLDALRERLREDYGLVPILFDWEPSEGRDLTETVVTLAGMCRFIVADLTDAKSIPQELSHIIPTFQSVPIRPIILASQKEYAMHEHWERFNNVLSIFDYNDLPHLLANLKAEVVDPIEAWEEAADKKAAQRREAAARERRLKEVNARQAAEIATLKAQMNAQQ